MENERCKEHKCGGERKPSNEFDRELESGPGLFDGVLVDDMSTHSEVGTSLASSAYIEWLSQQRNRSTFDAAQGFHHTHIKDPDQAQLSSRSPCSGQAERVARGRSGAQEIRLSGK